MLDRSAHARRAVLAVSGALALGAVVAGCGSDDEAGGASKSGGSSGSANPPTKPIKFDRGEFTLNPAIAKKVKNGEPINVVLSVVGQATPVYGSQYKYGFEQGIKEAEKEYGIKLNGKLIGPVQADANEQITQARAAIAAKDADCFVADAGSNPAFAPIYKQAAAQGIPTFTTGTDVEGAPRLSTFHTDWVKEGQSAAQAAVEQLKKKGVDIKKVAMTTGASDQVWAQTRMKAFSEEMQKLVPGAEMVNTPDNALDTTFEPSKVYSGVRAFLQGHPGVQVLYQTDVSGETVDKVIKDLKLKGKTFTAGHNVSDGVFAGIEDGYQLVTIDQQYVDQAGFAPKACAALLAQGKVLPNSNDALAITPDNLAESKEAFKQSTGGA